MEKNPIIDNWFADLNKLLRKELSKENIDAWLFTWNKIESEFNEKWVELFTLRNKDVTDQIARKKWSEFSSSVIPEITNLSLKLKMVFVDKANTIGSLKQLSFFNLFARESRQERELNKEITRENQILMDDILNDIENIRVSWGSEELFFGRIHSILVTGKREEREQVWLLYAREKLKISSSLYPKIAKSLEHRKVIAVEAGYKNFADYYWSDKEDLTKKEAVDLQINILEAVTPLQQNFNIEKSRLLGVDALFPWDIDFEDGSSSIEITKKTGVEVLRLLTDKFLTRFPTFCTAIEDIYAGQIDINFEEKKSKQGFFAFKPVSKKTLIFMNYKNTIQSFATLTHEFGHAVHGVLVSKNSPWVFDYYGSDRNAFSESVAFFFELIALELLFESPQTVEEEKVRKIMYREKLSRFLLRLHHVAKVELLEHRLFSSELALSEEEVKEIYLEIDKKYNNAISRDKLTEFDSIRWIDPRSLREPFTLGLYGRALIGTLAFFKNYLNNPEAALQKFFTALNQPLSFSDEKLYGILGLEYPFTKSEVADAVDMLQTLMQKSM
jgi:oligoendopeptidase F